MKPDKKRFAYLAYECDLLSIQKVVNDTSYGKCSTFEYVYAGI